MDLASLIVRNRDLHHQHANVLKLLFSPTGHACFNRCCATTHVLAGNAVSRLRRGLLDPVWGLCDEKWLVWMSDLIY
jgi:hypothetical protein